MFLKRRLRRIFTSHFLAKIRKKALRNGCWWSALESSDRAFLDLTIKVVRRVRNENLCQILKKIIKRLQDSFKSTFLKFVEFHSLVKAKRLSKQALSWGSRDASSWAHDPLSAKYLTVIEVNCPVGFTETGTGTRFHARSFDWICGTSRKGLMS